MSTELIEGSAYELAHNYRPLFPYFGGKSRIAHEVWRRLGNVPNYVEPFFGSGAVLFMRPHAPHIETVNDADGHLANFWRSVQAEADAVAKYADWPVNEADLHARHAWLVRNKPDFTQWLIEDPDHYDAKCAGWWLWGICQWIGSGWCASTSKQLPHLGNAGMGIHAPSRQLPHLGNAGRGIHAPSRQLPHLGNAGRGIHDEIERFQSRLRSVRVCCGDWSRVCGPSPTVRNGVTGVFLDPPYTSEAGRKKELYATDCGSVGHEVHRWAVEQGDNPRMRIAVCGYEGEYDWPDTWECFAWKAKGGYGSQSSHHDNPNAARERIWFSPHCLKPTLQQSLLGGQYDHTSSMAHDET